MSMFTQAPPRHAPREVPQDGPVLLATKPLNGHPAPLAVARWLARREDRDLDVVSVLHQGGTVPAAPGMMPLPQSFYDGERRDVLSWLEEELAPGSRDDARMHLAVLDGPTARTVVDAARARSARVIVIGTGGHDAIGRHIFGERALQILDRADRPVLVVPVDAHAGPVATAVVAVDFSGACMHAASAVVPMLSHGSRLHLVHVRRRERGAEELVGWPDGATTARCTEEFRAFLRQLPTMPGVHVETHTLWGEPAPSIVDFATRHRAGLIACGRLSHSFVERLFVRSVSSAVVRHAACPVLVVPGSTAA